MPLSHSPNSRKPVSNAPRTHLLPASWLNVVSPGECEPITPPQSPAVAEAMPVHFTSSSTSMTMPVEPSMPAMRRVRESIKTMPRPAKVERSGSNSGQYTRLGVWAVQTVQKGCIPSSGNSHPPTRNSSTEDCWKGTTSQNPTKATVIGRTATNRGGMRQLRSTSEAMAMPMAQNSCQGASCASFGRPVGTSTAPPSIESTANEPLKIAQPMEPRKPATTG
mmetsp:Transcript_83195/g.239137  ORF Transcript_83195/g.239137 Transcript_83195/m.239137 type:complete len:221 (-) Transcript_83195:992-1654(-)